MARDRERPMDFADATLVVNSAVDLVALPP